MSDDMYIIYDHGAYADLAEDDDFIVDLCDRLDVDAAELSISDICSAIADSEAIGYGEDVSAICERFEAQVNRVHPDWPGFSILARGASQRWDGVSSGHTYYDDFSSLVGDTGYYGLFKDCDIDLIWEDRDGDLHVEGVHHDGRVSVAVKAVRPDAEERERSLDGDAARTFVDKEWNNGVCADMAGYYGYRWPSKKANPSENAAAACRATASRAPDGTLPKASSQHSI